MFAAETWLRRGVLTGVEGSKRKKRIKLDRDDARFSDLPRELSSPKIGDHR
ncbi:hypothetical protein [Nitrobacter sp. 62-13]|uniref:hypothetical protein n=1 Tax=Nitrobacter sp. 62-13 TaxID=1895797 RepID=UPI000AA61175|nr:hypothetical protein [Nitrobacter sp. 62-13]